MQNLIESATDEGLSAPDSDANSKVCTEISSKPDMYVSIGINFCLGLNKQC
jgi:hypothetical protein